MKISQHAKLKLHAQQASVIICLVLKSLLLLYLAWVCVVSVCASVFVCVSACVHAWVCMWLKQRVW